MLSKLNLPNTTLVQVSDLKDPELVASRETRTGPEFASTTKPAFLQYMLNSGSVGPADLLVFIDPDFFFYESPEAIFKKMYDSGSIIITSHRFPKQRENEQFMKGKFNAGFMGFRNDANTRICLAEWRKQCIDWCYIRFEDGKIGDQGYLTEWPNKYKGVYVLPDLGVNLSTWNIANYSIKESGSGHFLIDGQPLICYHFHGMRLYFDRKNRVQAAPITVFNKDIYRPYVQALQRAYDRLQTLEKNWTLGTIPNPGFLRILKQKLMRAFQ